MAEVTIKVNGRVIKGDANQTILETCQRAGIFIPSFGDCHHPLTPIRQTCFISAVKIEGEQQPVPACSRLIHDRMEIETEAPEIKEIRKEILSLLLERHYGDCVAPCSLACPGELDVQGYVAHIARGNYLDALKLIWEKLPLPATVGRVCPHPCEEVCRRTRVEEPISIKELKRFVADYALKKGVRLRPLLPPDSGRRVAIIGGGPAGLSAAYYLRGYGHRVTIFEKRPKLGGLLRYGIPAYRLPREILDQEVQQIVDLEVEVKTGQELGNDFSISELRRQGFHAIFLSTGAWRSSRLGIAGEETPGVIYALDFLSQAAAGDIGQVPGRVIVVGGGNAAMDACRTSLRLGAKEVILLYRRTQREMPANIEEVKAAEEEGVNLKFLVAPTKVLIQHGKVSGLEYLQTELREADGSGRPRPVPILGSETQIETDLIIAAIGQSPDISFLEIDKDLHGLAFTEGGYPMADTTTLQTSVPFLFTGGDFYRGPQTVIQAVADGRRAARSIHQYLTAGRIIPEKKIFNISKGDLEEVDPINFERIPKHPRNQPQILPPEERKLSFAEVELGLNGTEAQEEAKRCLSCGCLDTFECRLREFATFEEVESKELSVWKKARFPIYETHPFIQVDPNKCISCGNCAYLCGEYQVQKAMELWEVKEDSPPGYLIPFINERCVSCGLCVGQCPTGALQERIEGKPGPFQLKRIQTTCTYCGVGCQIYLDVAGTEVLRVEGVPHLPPNFGHLCVKGKFSFHFINHHERLRSPLIRENGKFREASWEEALDVVSRQFRNIREKFGPPALASLTSARVTNEENYLMQKLVRTAFRTNNIDHCARL